MSVVHQKLLPGMTSPRCAIFQMLVSEVEGMEALGLWQPYVDIHNHPSRKGNGTKPEGKPTKKPGNVLHQQLLSTNSSWTGDRKAEPRMSDNKKDKQYRKQDKTGRGPKTKECWHPQILSYGLYLQRSSFPQYKSRNGNSSQVKCPDTPCLVCYCPSNCNNKGPQSGLCKTTEICSHFWTLQVGN